MKKALFFPFILFSLCIYSQVGIGTTTPQSALDITSTNDGLLIPRVALTSTTVAAPVLSITTSEMVYNTATVGDVSPGYYFWNGSIWVPLGENNGWRLNGNAGTIAGANFLGTIDNIDMIFKRNNIIAGRINTLHTSFGLNAQLATNLSGWANSAFGLDALKANNNGGNNSAFGAQALQSNTTGFYNSAFGDQALMSNVLGGYNTAVGYHALNKVDGWYNSAIGANTMKENTSGWYNTGVGMQALMANTIGWNNTATGYGALSGNTSGDNNTAAGYEALLLNTIGTYNTSVGFRALSGVTSGSNNIGIGNNAQVPNAAASNQVRIGNNAITYAGVQVPWTITSDKHWKNTIQPSNLGLSFINKLNPVYYFRNNDDSKKTEYGFIAQELDEVLIAFGAFDNGIVNKDDNGLLSIRYNDLMAPIVKAIQEQQLIIEEEKEKNLQLTTEINELNKRQKSLQKRLESIENKIKAGNEIITRQ